MATGAMATVDMLMLLTTMFSTEFTTGLSQSIYPNVSYVKLPKKNEIFTEKIIKIL